jgi:RNA polymerase sigma-70 factor (ECF subfamily)
MSGMGEQVSLNSGEINIDATELEQKIDALLNTLPKRCREIYIMSRKENLSIAEIAERFNISKRTVENQLTVALKHLRKAIEYVIIVAFLNSM